MAHQSGLASGACTPVWEYFPNSKSLTTEKDFWKQQAWLTAHAFRTYTSLHHDLWYVILRAYLPGILHEEADGTWISIGSGGKFFESAFCHPDRAIINLEATDGEGPVEFKKKQRVPF